MLEMSTITNNILADRWTEILVLAILIVCSVSDIRRKEIPLLFVGTGILGVLGLDIWRIWQQDMRIWEGVLSLLPGLCFWFLAFASRQKVGYGDGFMLILLGLGAGFLRCLTALCVGLLLSAVTGIVLLVIRKAHRGSEIPFAPFLALGTGIGLFL